MTLKLGMQHRVLEYYQVCSNDDPGLTMTYFTARSNLVPCAFVSEKGKTMDFSETIVVYDIKVGRYNQLNEYMKLYENQRSRSFIDLGPNLSIFLNFISSITTRPIEAKFHVEPPWDGRRKACSNGPGTWPRWQPCPYLIKYSKIFYLNSLEPKGRWPWNLVCSIGCSSTTKFDPMMTLGWPWPILWQGQIWSLMLLVNWLNAVN